MLHVEGAIATALRLRGFEVHAVICGGGIRACVKREITDNVSVTDWQHACTKCKASTSAVLESMNIPYSFIDDFVPEASWSRLWAIASDITWETIDKLHYGNVNLGKNTRSAILRYLKGYDLRNREDIVHEYAFSALVVAAAATRAIEQIAPSRIFMSHAVYVDWGPAWNIAFSQGIPTTAWMASYLKGRFYFRHLKNPGNMDFHNISSRAWEARNQADISPSQSDRLDKFLKNRYQKHISFDMRRFKEYSGDTRFLRKKYNLINSKPVWGIMTHINWDSVSDYSPMAYSLFDDWIIDTLNEIINLPDIQWLIKIHPAETWCNPDSGAQRLIEKHFPSLPDHVRVIPAEAEINPFDFFQMITGGVTVYGTAGLEIALLGKPVILAGEAHYGQKGFTYDGLSQDRYRQFLRQASSLPPLNNEQWQSARKYAYCYFIQRQIPIPVVENPDPEAEWWAFQASKTHLLAPGQDPYIDFICKRILDDEDFIMDENLVSSLYDDGSDKIALPPNNLIAPVKSKQSPSQNQVVSTNGSPSKLLGFDPLGEVFTYQGHLLRGIFPGCGLAVKKILQAYQQQQLWKVGIVKTTLKHIPDVSNWGYDLVLEHEIVPFISYAHEWAPEMLKDAALFQLRLNSQLLVNNLLIKDCGVSSNVLFNFAQPVFVDFLSLLFSSDLAQESWLEPTVLRSPFQLLWSKESSYFNEIFCRMFYPGLLYPLYLMHQGRHSYATKRLLETALNTTTEAITEQETFVHADSSLKLFYQQALAAKEYTLVNDGLFEFLKILQTEIEGLQVSPERSGYSDYYDQKNENYDFVPSTLWQSKQWAIYQALQRLHPSSVLDLGANTGWFSILAAKMGCQVVAVDNDVASLDILYRRAKHEDLSILPLFMDVLQPTPNVPAATGLANDPHMLNSKITGEVPLLLAANKRLKCDLVLALALIHHLTLGRGLNFKQVIELLTPFSKRYLLLEFVAKDDPLIASEPQFFVEFSRSPHSFEWYTLQKCYEVVIEYYQDVEIKQLTSTRALFICSNKRS